jgi:hypothetical protein
LTSLAFAGAALAAANTLTVASAASFSADLMEILPIDVTVFAGGRRRPRGLATLLRLGGRGSSQIRARNQTHGQFSTPRSLE